MSNPFGSLGAWFSRSLPAQELVGLSRELEERGDGTVWLGGGRDPGVFDVVQQVLSGTERITVATGIVNIWVETPQTVTEAWHRLEEAHPGRLYVGVGVSHAPLVQALDLDYSRPLARTREFLDGLDAQTDPVPHDRLLLAALGPGMLALAAERTLGTHPYLTTVDNTAAARAGVGADAIVATELGVVLQPDLPDARRQARESIAMYFGLPNYTNNWRRAGFTDEDLRDGGSDRLIDALVALGDADAIAERIAAHHRAGADHVCVQVLGNHPDRSAVLRALSARRTA